MREYNKEFTDEVFKLIPEANWISVDLNGKCFWCIDKPELFEFTWSSYGTYIGRVSFVSFAGSWKDTLVKRKWEPKEGENIFYPDPLSYSLYVCNSHPKSDGDTRTVPYFRTKEEAIACARKMLEAVK
jgi:hypothetical protein